MGGATRRGGIVTVDVSGGGIREGRRGSDAPDRRVGVRERRGDSVGGDGRGILRGVQGGPRPRRGRVRRIPPWRPRRPRIPRRIPPSIARVRIAPQDVPRGTSPRQSQMHEGALFSRGTRDTNDPQSEATIEIRPTGGDVPPRRSAPEGGYRRFVRGSDDGRYGTVGVHAERRRRFSSRFAIRRGRTGIEIDGEGGGIEGDGGEAPRIEGRGEGFIGTPGRGVERERQAEGGDPQSQSDRRTSGRVRRSSRRARGDAEEGRGRQGRGAGGG
mmetsp:Transcript_33952/g.101327  ORF Transcript_33952/g.101327 Transcript_33952/m.101327 type:complete len:271 (+) Transcript_33952:440-1252(+)